MAIHSLFSHRTDNIIESPRRGGSCANFNNVSMYLYEAIYLGSGDQENRIKKHHRVSVSFIMLELL